MEKNETNCSFVFIYNLPLCSTCSYVCISVQTYNYLLPYYNTKRGWWWEISGGYKLRMRSTCRVSWYVSVRPSRFVSEFECVHVFECKCDGIYHVFVRVNACVREGDCEWPFAYLRVVLFKNYTYTQTLSQTYPLKFSSRFLALNINKLDSYFSCFF